MIENVWFYVFSILTVVILSFLIPLIRMKLWWFIPVVTLVVMTLAGFILPNFYDRLSWEPLIGYAVFLTILSIIMTILAFMYVRKRKKRKEGKLKHDREEYD